MNYKTHINELREHIHSLRLDVLSNQQKINAQIKQESRWLIKEVLGHLVDSCDNNRQRIIRLKKEKNNWFSEYDQDLWVERQNYRNIDVLTIVNCLYYSNMILIELFENLLEGADEEYHFGNDKKLTLRAILEDYVEHFKHHINKLSF